TACAPPAVESSGGSRICRLVAHDASPVRHAGKMANVLASTRHIVGTSGQMVLIPCCLDLAFRHLGGWSCWRGATEQKNSGIVGLLLALSLVLTSAQGRAQATGQLEVRPGPDLSAYVDRPLGRVEVRLLGKEWVEPVKVHSVH